MKPPTSATPNTSGRNSKNSSFKTKEPKGEAIFSLKNSSRQKETSSLPKEFAEVTAEEVFERLRHITVGGNICVYSKQRCAALAPVINRINYLKHKRKALVLAHSYVSPEIIYLVADKVGDSYYLSQMAKQSPQQEIIYAAVRFMAETGKVLNPQKRFFVAAENDGCTLADSITGEEVAALREKHPNYTFVCYINTTAEVKAHCDVCVTSSNVYDIVEKLPSSHIYFLPDKLMGQNLKEEMQKRGVDKTILLYDGNCYVHKAYDAEMIDYLQLKNPQLRVLAHPECAPNVVAKAHYTGSTSGIIRHIAAAKQDTFFVLSECGLVSRLQKEMPHKKFIGSCTLCRYMKDNRLENILGLLEFLENEDSPSSAKSQNNRGQKANNPREILLDNAIIQKAKTCIDRMFELATPSS